MMRRLVSPTRSKVTLILCAAVSVMLVVAAGSLAYYSSTGAGTSTTSIGSLPAPVIGSITPGSGTISLSWAPGVTPPDTGAVSYYVSRDGGDAAGCPTSAAPTGVTSCTDTNPPPGSHSYTVTAVWRTWTAVSGADSGTPISAPTVSSATPSSRSQGATNQNIVIAGTGFVSGAVASFSGTGITVNSTTATSSTSLTANITIAGGAPVVSRDITVTNPDAGAGTGVGIFTVNPPPTLTSATPSSRGQGATNQTVTLTGTGFASGASLAASFGSLITVHSTTFVNSTTLTATISVGPAATTGVRNVTVTNGDGVIATGHVFTVNAAPTVTSATPSSRGQGAVSQNIAIVGTSFVSGATVSFSGTGITVNSTTFVSATSLTADISIAAGATTGLRNVLVTNPDAGVGTRVNGFTVNTGPTVTSATPSSRGQGATNQNIVVAGTGFAAGAVASFSGTGITVDSTTFNSATQVTANITIAAGATVGARDVVVTNTDGGRGTGTGAFTVVGIPTVASASPNSRGRGAASQAIVITGTNFVSGATVTFSGTGITVNSTAFASSTSLTATISIAAGATLGTRNITVNNNNGGTTGTCTGCFTVNAAPTVTSATPSSRGQGAVNQNIAIVGTGFVNGATVSFSGTGITVNSTTFNSATSLTANISIAAGATVGSRSVTVTNPDAGVRTRANAFGVVAGPTVSSAAPASRPQGATNQNIVITGTGFAAGAVASFSGTGITVNSTTFNSTTQLTVNITIAAGATVGARDVTATNTNAGVGTGVGVFTVLAFP